jgi:hypothetical protein
MIVSILIAASAAGATPMPAQPSAPAEIQVDVGKGNFASLPPLQAVDRRLPSPGMVERVEKMLSAGTCSLPGQSAAQFDITVPYAVQVQPDGSASRVIVSEVGCPALESYVGLLVLERARQGDFAPSKAAQTRWYGDDINFNLR